MYDIILETYCIWQFKRNIHCCAHWLCSIDRFKLLKDETFFKHFFTCLHKHFQPTSFSCLFKMRHIWHLNNSRRFTWNVKFCCIFQMKKLVQMCCLPQSLFALGRWQMQCHLVFRHNKSRPLTGVNWCSGVTFRGIKIYRCISSSKLRNT